MFQIHRHSSGSIFARSRAPDGVPPKYLRKKSWEVHASHSLQSHLEQALGLDTTLRARLPYFTFPISGKHPAPAPVVVGKWYCPCVFVREAGCEAKHQMNKSMFYKMALQQNWEELHTLKHDNGDDTREGFVWFGVMTHEKQWRGVRLGVSEAIAEKMKWVMKEGGWVDDVDGSGREMSVETVEVYKGHRKWKRFGCYVLVESFVLTRLDGSLVLKCDFRHADRIQCKWE
ncbi:hypothetical protein NL676_005363 [Syzygium grande]|nr:hypothetical protein NL676_005363 [Syzygium grande]